MNTTKQDIEQTLIDNYRYLREEFKDHIKDDPNFGYEDNLKDFFEWLYNYNVNIISLNSTGYLDSTEKILKKYCNVTN